jgi:hypothetical protein
MHPVEQEAPMNGLGAGDTSPFMDFKTGGTVRERHALMQKDSVNLHRLRWTKSHPSRRRPGQ